MTDLPHIHTSQDLQRMLASLGFESEDVPAARLPVPEDIPRCMIPLGYNPSLENSVAVAIKDGSFALYVYEPYFQLTFRPWVTLASDVSAEALRQAILQAGLTETLEQVYPAAAPAKAAETLTAAAAEQPISRQVRRMRLAGDLLLLLGLFALILFWIEKQVVLFILAWIWLLVVYWIRRKS
jgi:hypothetical protein